LVVGVFFYYLREAGGWWGVGDGYYQCVDVGFFGEELYLRYSLGEGYGVAPGGLVVC
jgi:hypothetical protein